MVRRKQDTTDETQAPPEAPAPQAPAEVPDVKLGEPYKNLRLKQNEFVRGKLELAGTVHQFPEAEAARRLLTQQFWEIA